MHRLHRVVPGPTQNKPVVRSTIGRAKAIGSAIYVALSLACSAWYLHLLDPVFSNDIGWANYTSNRDQALLIDLLNQALTIQAYGRLDLLASTASSYKTYATVASTTSIDPTYSRRLILARHAPEFAVVCLRAMDVAWVWNMYTQFCWVDVAHVFEMGLTAARQARCNAKYAANGAMYMELVIRNQVWDDFVQYYGGPGGAFTVTVQAWVEQVVPHGPALLASLSTALNSTTVDQEVEYWLDHNISYFQTQWHNEFQPGITETLQIENAFGLSYAITLKKLASTNEIWTSANMFWTEYFNAAVAGPSGSSLVRAAPNFIMNPSEPLNIETFQGLSDAATGEYIRQAGVFRTLVGAFESVDTYYIPVPSELLALYLAYQTSLYAALETNGQLLDNLESIVLTPMPSTWLAPDLVFGGGNPMCIFQSTTLFVQQSFSFYDACDKESPLSIEMTGISSLFGALTMLEDIASLNTCQYDANPNNCANKLGTTLQMAMSLPYVHKLMQPNIAATYTVIDGLNIGIMQFAQNQSNWTMLHQPLLQDLSFALVGWVMLYDWVEGKREVVSFEGDASTIVLISELELPLEFTSSTNYIGTAVRIIYFLVVYVSFVLFAISLVCFLWSWHIGSQTAGHNLVWFNHLVSSVWVGRPLLSIRGATAVLMLSSTQIQLVEASNSSSRFQFVPRSIWNTMIVSGEATWIVYVWVDLFTIATGRNTKAHAPLSCALAWLAINMVEYAWPVLPVIELNRMCTLQNMDQSISCTAGVLQIGSLLRTKVMIAILGGAYVFSILLWTVARYLNNQCSLDATSHHAVRHLLGAGDVYLDLDEIIPLKESPSWSMDKVSCIMAGLIPFQWKNRWHLFDVNLWLLHKDGIEQSRQIVNFVPYIPSHPICIPVQSHVHKHASNASRFIQLIHAIKTTSKSMFAIAYVITSIVGSVSYLEVSRVNLANDIFWANFNMTGVHAFIGNWLNQELVLGPANKTFRFTLESINEVGTIASGKSVIESPTNYGALVQHTEMATLDATIPGLRTTDPCFIPWIFTQYCFLDFEQRWEMANSAKRQLRCQQMTSNGAVFLESILRNIDYDAFHICWGRAFDRAVVDELNRSDIGRLWLRHLTQGPMLSVSEEVAIWQAYGITSFNTQWQNFKQIGLSNFYSVQNAFGILYPLTLQSQSYMFRLQKQTTFKMYWGLANDLIAVAQNSSNIAGLSLLRSSPTFAFQNTTIQSLLVANGTLAWPIPEGFSLIHDAIGPFGSVDMFYVSSPSQVTSAVHIIVTALHRSLAANVSAQRTYVSVTDGTSGIFPAPMVWIDLNHCTTGGSPVCPELQVSTCVPPSLGLKTYLTFSMQCSVYFEWTVLAPNRQMQVAAVILARLSTMSNDKLVSICNQDPQFFGLCLQYLNQTAKFVRDTMSIDELNDAVVEANAVVRTLNFEFIQYGAPDMTSPLQLDRLKVFNPLDDSFDYFSWLYIVDWVLGVREGVTFEGDHGSLSVLTEPLHLLQQEVNMAEFPVNVAFYMRSAVFYITGTMIALFLVAFLYVVICRGFIEVLNLLELQRVGAIVWIGRPLLFVRSLTALAMLSTATLKLNVRDNITLFTETHNPWYKTLLSANEITWLVAIVNDMAMMVTKDYTVYYATINSILVWFLSFTLSYVAPVVHTATIEKQCHVLHIDFQIECSSGVVKLGDPTRLVTLFCIALGCNCVCYGIARIYLKRDPSNPIDSIYLYSGAKYLFLTSPWTHNNVYYMDRMSGFLNGILSFHRNNVIYGLDVKLWHTFKIPLQDDPTMPEEHPLFESSRFAIPLDVEGCRVVPKRMLIV
ncbi:Aste57867_16568 [Aphanomyces stellatus]|uniref:Aste57867_16560 protein n=1 Tax=Aphanomyces stellatus TaxID=120398 RepID=A0A485L5Y9_9STRA|nr:hypothetical protein As57867_016503 [Aphanomyces stellatus]KAF0692357.1 hypothetical protein As57867_016511 [Aphanomyces stellatus]VFT93333.1 Aste57867_16560 [Aphanomyces stellatus]VFT93341.1 Aste57867_16568 [Aphanomyces stellatus]